MTALQRAINDLVIANRILAYHGVFDEYGHVSMRHPDDPSRYLLSRSRSPELVESADILEYTLDGACIGKVGGDPRFVLACAADGEQAAVRLRRDPPGKGLAQAAARPRDDIEIQGFLLILSGASATASTPRGCALPCGRTSARRGATPAKGR